MEHDKLFQLSLWASERLDSEESQQISEESSLHSGEPIVPIRDNTAHWKWASQDYPPLPNPPEAAHPAHEGVKAREPQLAKTFFYNKPESDSVPQKLKQGPLPFTSVLNIIHWHPSNSKSGAGIQGGSSPKKRSRSGVGKEQRSSLKTLQYKGEYSFFDPNTKGINKIISIPYFIDLLRTAGSRSQRELYFGRDSKNSIKPTYLKQLLRVVHYISNLSEEESFNRKHIDHVQEVIYCAISYLKKQSLDERLLVASLTFLEESKAVFFKLKDEPNKDKYDLATNKGLQQLNKKEMVNYLIDEVEAIYLASLTESQQLSRVTALDNSLFARSVGEQPIHGEELGADANYIPKA